MAEDGYEAGDLKVLWDMPPPRRRPDGFVTGEPLSDEAWSMLALWEGRPDAGLNPVYEVGIPFAERHGRGPVTFVNELIGAGLAVLDGAIRLTEEGKALLASRVRDHEGKGPPGLG